MHASAIAAMADRALNLFIADHDLLDSADADSLLKLEYLNDSEGTGPPANPTL